MEAKNRNRPGARAKQQRLEDQPQLEDKLFLMAALSRRRDRLLECPALDLRALRALMEDYEAAGLECGAADLRRRVEWYCGKKSV
jgi:hypothetical protein